MFSFAGIFFQGRDCIASFSCYLYICHTIRIAICFSTMVFCHTIPYTKNVQPKCVGGDSIGGGVCYDKTRSYMFTLIHECVNNCLCNPTPTLKLLFHLLLCTPLFDNILFWYTLGFLVYFYISSLGNRS